jgi:xylonate dehydratase
MSRDPILDSGDDAIYALRTTAPGPAGKLPLEADRLRRMSSGELFGWTQNAGMGWSPAAMLGKQFLILSTQGGHWEVGLLMEEAAREFAAAKAIPFAGYVSDPCDGRTNGTNGMLDSLPYRNDAAMVLRRLIRSLPTRRGVLGVATCDKGLPAMLMALAGSPDLPTILVPGGVTLLAEEAEDTGKVQTLATRFARDEITLEHAAEMGCRACGSPGGGCQFMGTAATSQVVAEALGLALPHAALAPSGSPIWRDVARRSARALLALDLAGTVNRDFLTDDSVHNAMVCHAAFGGSTNLVLHIPAIAHAAGLRRPTVDDWARINRAVPRIVDSLPNGPRHFATVQVYLAGGVPEAMLHLRELGLLKLDARTVTGRTLGDNLAWWEKSDRRARLREKLRQLDGIDPGDVIMPAPKARERGLTSTVTFLRGAHLLQREPGHRRHQGRHRQPRRRHGARRHRPRLRHARDLPGHLRPEACEGRPAHRAHHRRPFLRRFHRRLRGPHQPRGLGRRSDRPPARWRHHPPAHRHAQPRGLLGRHFDLRR